MREAVERFHRRFLPSPLASLPCSHIHPSVPALSGEPAAGRLSSGSSLDVWQFKTPDTLAACVSFTPIMQKYKAFVNQNSVIFPAMAEGSAINQAFSSVLVRLISLFMEVSSSFVFLDWDRLIADPSAMAGKMTEIGIIILAYVLVIGLLILVASSLKRSPSEESGLFKSDNQVIADQQPVRQTEQERLDEYEARSPRYCSIIAVFDSDSSVESLYVSCQRRRVASSSVKLP